MQYAQNAFQGNGYAYNEEAKVAELERLIGQLTIENSLLKKSYRFTSANGPSRRGQMSQGISQLAQQGYNVESFCQALGLPRASYYRHIQASYSVASPADTALRQQVRQVALEWSC